MVVGIVWLLDDGGFCWLCGAMCRMVGGVRNGFWVV